jgi:ABC-type antimicrobial peptide transport system permease subunit
MQQTAPALIRQPVIVARIDPRGQGLGANIAAAVKSMGQEYVRDVLTIEDQLDATLLRERLLMKVSALFGLMALVLGGLGLFGLQSDRVIRRRAEIGVRLAMGASQARITRGVIVDGLGLTGLGLMMGLPAALAAGRVVQAQLYGISPGSAGILIMVAIGIGGVTVLATLVPARRAARVNPLDALRTD